MCLLSFNQNTVKQSKIYILKINHQMNIAKTQIKYKFK